MKRLLLTLILAAFLSSSASPSPAPQALRIVVFSDFNGPYGSTTYSPPVAQVIQRITTEWRPDIVLSAGDVVAGQNRNLPDGRFPQMWRAFDAVVAAPLRAAGVPLAVALGNHDASAARSRAGGFVFKRERAYTAAYWRDPDHRPRLDYSDAGHFPFYYSFVIKDVFVAVLDATSHIIQDEAWVLRTLRSPAAQAARMRIVVGHLPLYGISAGRSKFGEVIERGQYWQRVFEEHRVDVYVSGHHAAYYPAHRSRLRLLHSGGGVGPRRYVGHPDVPSYPTVTVMDLNPEARTVTLETFDTETGRRVAPSELPSCINGYNGPVFRIDLPQRDRCGAP